MTKWRSKITNAVYKASDGFSDTHGYFVVLRPVDSESSNGYRVTFDTLLEVFEEVKE